MNLILTTDVPWLPNDLMLSWAHIKEYKNTDIPFLDLQLIEKSGNRKRINEHISSRVLLAELLIKGGIDPNKVNLKKTEQGKPYALIADEELHVSFSHSSDWVCCAVSIKHDIGIDCEPLVREVNPRIFSRILDDSEMSLLKEISPLAIWTMKEAVVKCIGTGIRSSLQRYRIRRKGELFYVNWEGKTIHIYSFVRENHQLAVAWRD